MNRDPRTDAGYSLPEVGCGYPVLATWFVIVAVVLVVRWLRG